MSSVTILERLQTIGFRNRKPEQPKEKISSASPGVVDLFKNSATLSNYKSVSEKLLKANKGWVYKNNDAVAKEVGNIEFELFSVKRVKGEIVLDPITIHPLLEALDRFNEFTSKTSGFYLTESHQNLTGDAFWYVDGKGINIKGIYLLQPDKVELSLGDPSYGQFIINAYKYKDTIDGKQVEETYEPDEIVHFKQPNPDNPYRGKSKVEAASEEIDTDNLAQLANKRLYQQGLISNFVLSTEKFLTDEQAQSVEAKLKANYAGAKNAYKTLILSGGLRPESITLTNKEMETIALQKWFRDKIMSIFGNTPSSIGIVEDVNRANAESGILHWKRTTIKSEMKTIADTINEFLLPRFGDNLVLGFKDPVPEDRQQKIDETVKLRGANIITPNEAREGLGYDPVNDEGADELAFNPVNPIVETLPKSVQNIDHAKYLRRTTAFKEAVKFQERVKQYTPVAEKIVAQRKKKREKNQDNREHTKFTNEQVWEFHNKQIRRVEAHEQIFRDRVEKYILLLVETALEQMPQEVADMQKKALIDDEVFKVKAQVDFTPLLMDVGTLAAQDALNFVDDDSAYVPTDLRKTVALQVKKFAESLIETDKDKLVNMIAQGVADGNSIPVIRNEILQEFEEYSKMQAERITRTEVIRASNEGTLDAWKQSEVVEAKQWLTAEDERVSEDCMEMNGVIVGLEKDYDDEIRDILGNKKAGQILSYGHVEEPPLHPNCRCTLLPVLVD